MTHFSTLKRIFPFFCAASLGALAAACGTTDVPFGEQARNVQPVIPSPKGGPTGGGTRPGTSCEFGGFSWESQPFALYPDEQTCLGDQWVRYDAGLGLWVGLTTCDSSQTRVYLSASPEGPFAAAADTAGHGQDHCELVNANFTLTNEDDITSGGCTTCSTGPNLPLEGLPSYARANLGEAFQFVESTPEWSHQVSRLSCGVELGCKQPPPSDPPPQGEPWPYGTAYGGNADGPHACNPNQGSYSHYEAPADPGAAALHIIGVSGPPESGEIAVSVTRPGPAVLLLSAYKSTKWVITAAPGATIERVILNGFEEQTAVAPAGVPVESRSFSNDVIIFNLTRDWPGVAAANLTASAEEAAGRSLTSFRSCSEASSFEIAEPGELKPPHPHSTKVEPTLPPGCEALANESNYCISLNHGAEITAIGLDSGTLCKGPLLTAGSTDSSSIGWVGDYIYACDFERGLYRVSVLDGSVDVAPVSCDAATSHAGGLLVADLFPFGSLPRGLQHYDSFEAVVLGQAGQSYGLSPFDASRFATNGDQLYASWHATTTIETAPLSSSELSTVTLEGFDNWVWAMDALDDGRLLISSGPFSQVDGFLVFDAQTGASQGVLPINGDGGPYYFEGLDCVSNPKRK